MDPNTGRLIEYNDLRLLRETDPEEAAKYTVELSGPADEVRRISEAVKAARRAEKKRARKARRANRSK